MFRPMKHFKVVFTAIQALLIAIATHTSCLETFNIDPSTITVSGFSSGGFMAAQLGIAHSTLFKGGFGVFAGGPYDCARNQSDFRNCLHPGHPSISLPLQNMAAWSADGSIDCLCNLRHRRIFVQSGTMDEVVGINITSLLHEQLVSFASPSNVQFVINEGFAHGMPTDANDSRLSPCNKNVPPFVGSCGYDGAGAVLTWLHNDSRLNDRNAGTLTGEIVTFAQSADFAAPGFADTGYMYVPACCNSGLSTKATTTGKCKLHVALHGCTMNYETIGDLFVKHAGYNAWADTNDVVVLYPQTTVDRKTYPT